MYLQGEQQSQTVSVYNQSECTDIQVRDTISGLESCIGLKVEIIITITVFLGL